LVRRSAIAMVLVLAGCGGGSTGSPAPEERTVAPSGPPEDSADEPPAMDDDPPPAAIDGAELDAMERSELEAACYAGSSAACDRLGH
jgi:hypothetical protein